MMCRYDPPTALRHFHEVCELALDEYQPDRELLQLRHRLIKEESKEAGEEFSEALRTGRLSDELRVKLTKELADILYVVYGAGVSFGIDLDHAFAAVHESNLSKLVDGKPLKDEGGKVQKGPNYQPPDERELAIAAGVAIEGEHADLE
jgi:hypothetical protein